MRYFKSDLLTLLVSLFIFSSCQKLDTVGLDIDPSEQLQGTLIDTITVRTSTVKEDSVLTSGLLQQSFGYLQDPVFGKTESDMAFTIGLPGDSSKVTFGTSPVLDSAVLVLRYGNEFYGDADNSTFAVNLHQLTEQISASQNYYSTRNWSFSPTAITSKLISGYALKDSVYITEIQKGQADTARKVAPQLRIRISNSFINSNFFNADVSNFASATAFASYIKGLYLTIDKASSTGNGGIVFFNTDSSALELYYKRQSGTEIDTNVLKFPVTIAANTLKHDYTGTVVQNQLDHPAQTFNTVFVQALGGLKTKINFPFIQNLKSLGHIVINKAELVVYVDQSSETLFNPAPRLTLYRTDIAGQKQEIPDNDFGQKNGYQNAHVLSEAAFGGYYDPTSKCYIFNIASYIQEILDGKLTQYDTFLAPVKYDLIRSTTAYAGNPDPRVTDMYPSGTTAGQSALGSGSAGNYKMKVNIIYTRLGQ